MNRTPATADPHQTAPQAQTGLPSFLHVSHHGPIDLEAYLHRYVDDLARAEFELGTRDGSA